MKRDNKGKKCPCGGKYEEQSLWDDWDGYVTCTKCQERIRRWQEDKDGTRT